MDKDSAQLILVENVFWMQNLNNFIDIWWIVIVLHNFHASTNFFEIYEIYQANKYMNNEIEHKELLNWMKRYI